MNLSPKSHDPTTEFEENAIVMGDAGVRGSYLQENEGTHYCTHILVNVSPKAFCELS